MKKLLFILASVFVASTHAQVIELHYDFGKQRKQITGTIETFKIDKLGNTFFFSDFDFNRPDGANLAYFELARKFNIPNKLIKGLNAHIEYNDGFLITKGNTPSGIPIARAWLAGFGFPITIGNFTLHTSYLYKNIYGSNNLDAQFTAVAMQNFFNNRLTIKGFIDVWSAPENTLNPSHKKVVILTEPQILFNINNTFSIGTELEISKNFVPYTDKWTLNPTIMAKWSL